MQTSSATITRLRRLIALPAALLFVLVLVGAPASSAAPATELVSLAITNADGDDLLAVPFDPTVYDLVANPDADDDVFIDVQGPAGSCITVTSPSSGPAGGCTLQGVTNQLSRPGPWTITVAVAGETDTVYTVDEGTAVPSSNADLASIDVTPGTLAPAFQAPTTSYQVAVGYLVNSATVTPTVADASATMTVQGHPSGSGNGVAVPLSLGANTVTIVVRAEDGTTTKTTTVTITRAGPSTNADLAALDPLGATLSPAFAPGTTAYNASVAYPIDWISLTPIVADATSTVKVNGSDVQWGDQVAVSLAVGVNQIQVEVTSQNGAKKTYVVRVTRAGPSTDATLADLDMSAPGMMPMFNPWLTGYWLWVTNDVKTVIANAQTNNGAATLALTLNDQVVSLGTALPLVVGHNVLRFRVTAQDGITVKDYMVDVQRTGSAPASPPPPPPTTTTTTTTTTGSTTTTPTTTSPTTTTGTATTGTTTTQTFSNAGASVEILVPEETGVRSDELPPVTTDEYVTTRRVELDISAPDGAKQVVVSNTADFKDAETFAVAPDGTYPWTLAADGGEDGKRTVYVRFAGTNVDAKKTISADILVDAAAPTLQSKYVDERRVYGRRTRVWISLAAKDAASGPTFVQLARDLKKPWSWFDYADTASFRTKGSAVWLRVADGAGNVSAWKRVAFPKKPVLHGKAAAKKKTSTR